MRLNGAAECPACVIFEGEGTEGRNAGGISKYLKKGTFEKWGNVNVKRDMVSQCRGDWGCE